MMSSAVDFEIVSTPWSGKRQESREWLDPQISPNLNCKVRDRSASVSFLIADIFGNYMVDDTTI